MDTEILRQYEEGNYIVIEYTKDQATVSHVVKVLKNEPVDELDPPEQPEITLVELQQVQQEIIESVTRLNENFERIMETQNR